MHLLHRAWTFKQSCFTTVGSVHPSQHALLFNYVTQITSLPTHWKNTFELNRISTRIRGVKVSVSSAFTSYKKKKDFSYWNYLISFSLLVACLASLNFWPAKTFSCLICTASKNSLMSSYSFLKSRRFWRHALQFVCSETISLLHRLKLNNTVKQWNLGGMAKEKPELLTWEISIAVFLICAGIQVGETFVK